LELNHDFQVSVPIEQAWGVLTDLERIAPCMPGAQLVEVDGDEYRGVVRVKVGPITTQYKGTAKMVDLDPIAHRAVLRAEGRETRGQGAASATVTATLTASEGGTEVHIETDLDISGKVAQFGRGALGEVSGKILDQFVRELEANVLTGPAPSTDDPAPSTDAGEAAPTASGPSGSSEATNRTEPTRRAIDSPAAAPVDLLDAAGPSVLKRVLPLVLVFVLFTVVRRLRRRR
jgi:carbon monoxide dehydrogenase subunit G